MISLAIGVGLALAVSVAIGRVRKINIGLVAIPFAYVIGAFFMHMKPSDVVELWPTHIFFVILAISLFFGFAMANGTLAEIANGLLHRFRAAPTMLPIMIFLASVLIAALGAGYYAVMVLMAPIALLVCRKVGISPLIGALCADCGGQVGSNFMVGLNGVIFRNLITSEGFSSNEAFVVSTTIFVVYLAMTFLIILAMLLRSSRQRRRAGTTAQEVTFAEPIPLDRRQRTNVCLIGVFVVVLLVPPILHLCLPGSSAVTWVNSRIDVSLFAVLFAVVCALMRVGTEKESLSHVPWSTLIMIGGMGMLVSIAVKAGTISLLAGWVGHTPRLFIPVVLCLLAAVLNMFGGSFVGVVAPALFPIVANLATATGMSPALLYTSTTIGGLATGISPFSAGGAMVLGFTDAQERDDMFHWEFAVGLPVCVGVALVVSLLYSLVAS